MGNKHRNYEPGRWPWPVTKWCEQDSASSSAEHSALELVSLDQAVLGIILPLISGKLHVTCSHSPHYCQRTLHRPCFFAALSSGPKLGIDTYDWPSLGVYPCLSWKQVSGIFRFYKRRQTLPVSISHKVGDSKLTGKRLAATRQK